MQFASGWLPTGILATVFDALTLRLFTGAAYANATGYPICDCNIVYIGVCIIKQCGLYVEEYKCWIT